MRMHASWTYFSATWRSQSLAQGYHRNDQSCAGLLSLYRTPRAGPSRVQMNPLLLLLWTHFRKARRLFLRAVRWNPAELLGFSLVPLASAVSQRPFRKQCSWQAGVLVGRGIPAVTQLPLSSLCIRTYMYIHNYNGQVTRYGARFQVVDQCVMANPRSVSCKE